MQKVWEVEHNIDRFHKQMKKKLNQARVQIENATRITQADKDHLKTTQQLITQTKSLVDEKLHSVNIKSQEGQLDILKLWKPLQEQVDHFQTVLSTVEKRPFCVSVLADEHFKSLISSDHEPILVQNESAVWTPLKPTTVHRLPSAQSFRPKKPMALKQITFNEPANACSQATPRSNDISTSFPKSRTCYRTVSLTTKPLTDGESFHKQSLRLQSIPNKVEDRHPTMLPRLTGCGPSSGEVAKVFNIRSLKLKGISQQSVFEFPCEDIIVMENNIVTITERAVQKFSIRYQFIESITLRAPLKLCYTRDDTSNVLVLDSSCGISLISIQPRLKLMYRVETDRA